MKNGFMKFLAGGMMLAGAMLAPGMADAAGYGFVNYQAVLAASPQLQQANKEMAAEQQKLQKDFNAQSKGMNDKDKQALAQKLDGQLAVKQQQVQKSLVVPAVEKIRAAIEKAAKDNQIDFVVQESAWLYGGQDLTRAVIAQIKK